jgi:hypothetical protein
MWRLVVGGILPSNRFTILTVMHQGEDSRRRDGGRGVDAQG